MSRWIGRIGTILAIASLFGGLARGDEPELARLREHVEILASREFAGRRDEGAAKARAYLIAEFRRLGLEPLFGGSYTQDVTGKGLGDVLGVNVGAKIPGADPGLGDRWVILGAHYDHLGRRGDVIFPGADDNASGVAMMLEVARCLAGSPEKPARGVAFVGFDLEEMGPKGEFGLRGSQFFCRNPPVPLDRVGLFVTADMIGRSLGGVCDPYVFVLGSEREPIVRPWIERASKGRPVKVGLLGSDIPAIDRSDYGPFRSRKIPYLFFTTGENPLYHSPRDVAGTLDYPKLEAISRIIGAVVAEAARSRAEPTWTEPPDHPIAEALTLRDIFKILLDHRQDLKIGGFPVALMNHAIRTVDGVAERGVMTPDERTRIIRAAQVVLFTVF